MTTEAPTLRRARQILAEIEQNHPDLDVPEGIRFAWSDRMTSAAGKCFYREKLVKLSRPIFSNPANWGKFDNTVKHEIAHHIVGPDRGRGGDAQSLDDILAGRYRRRGRANPHGPKWQRIHRQIGGDGERCHTMETPKSGRRQYEVICEECCAVMTVGIQRFRKIQGGAVYTHRCGNGRKGRVSA